MAKYLLTGATGRLGTPTLEGLLKKVPAKDVSVLARDPAKFTLKIETTIDTTAMQRIVGRLGGFASSMGPFRSSH